MKIQNQSVITIEFTLMDSDGTVLDTSEGDEPLVYLHGTGALVPGLEKVLTGRPAGDSLKVTVEPEEAYGLRDETSVSNLPRKQFSEIDDLSVGMQVHATTAEGEKMITVADIRDDEVTIDANHPLAGQSLTFDVTVVSVRKATSEELEHGHAHGQGHDHDHSHE